MALTTTDETTTTKVEREKCLKYPQTGRSKAGNKGSLKVAAVCVCVHLILIDTDTNTQTLSTLVFGTCATYIIISVPCAIKRESRIPYTHTHPSNKKTND